ncbi:methylated-DNA--[protein]-cysteine S-methyltransferase [Catenulispora yoronensis]|uniref:Methylated-DNA--[protein]-cysteine S-methyltransferase n=1 Tax=Catenulispora yoronensis TaxID=450799 RepID=A0ABP5FRD0_9ACTN
MSTLTYATIATPAGPFTVVADAEDTVHAAGFTDDPAFLAGLLGTAVPEPGPHEDVSKKVHAYFDGDLGAIDDVTIAYRATGPFRTRAWDAMRTVEPGRTISYTQLAATAGNPNAVRAAGSACASNPIALFVPCHRIVRSDGSSKNFLYGLECKATLLAHEKQHAEV